MGTTHTAATKGDIHLTEIIRVTDRATEYAKAVVENRKTAGPLVRLACERHLRDLKTKSDFVFDYRRAYQVIHFFETELFIKDEQGDYKPFELFDWQIFVLGNLFGWIQKKTKTKTKEYRRFRRAYIETGKGSGKSPLIAGIALWMLMYDGERSAQVYVAAFNQDQARVLFNYAKHMIEMNEMLSERLSVVGGANAYAIMDPTSNSEFRAISSEKQGRGKSGPIPHCIIIDELHEIPKADLIEFLDAGVKNRVQPLTILITNAGSDRDGPCWANHEVARDIVEEKIENETFFSFICNLDVGDDPFKNPKCWIKTNPSLPTIPGHAYLSDQVNASKSLVAKQYSVKRLNFCQWTEGIAGWIQSDLWMKAQKELNIDSPYYFKRRCWGGIDLALTGDLTAFVLVFEMWERGTGYYDVFSWFWMAGEKLLDLERRNGMIPHYQNWRKENFLLTTPGEAINFDSFARLLEKIVERFKPVSVAYDRSRIPYLKDALNRNQVAIPLVEHGQAHSTSRDGLSMEISIEQTEMMLLEGRLRVNPNPVLTHGVFGVEVKRNPTNPDQRYFKKAHERVKIDGAIALVQALGCAAHNKATRSSFRAEDIFVVDMNRL